MKKVVIGIIIILTTPAFKSHGQTVIANAGSYSQQVGYSVAWTLGETIASTVSNTSTTLTQGFHQVSGTIVGIDTPDEALHFSLYPNPFAEELSIQVSGAYQVDYKYRLTDLAGKPVIPESPITATSTQLNLSRLPAGIYFLSFSNSKHSLTYRIIKTN